MNIVVLNMSDIEQQERKTLLLIAEGYITNS